VTGFPEFPNKHYSMLRATCLETTKVFPKRGHDLLQIIVK
jgi:hypothetical protein